MNHARGGPPRQVRVMIVDDHPLLRDGVAACLEAQQGWTVVSQSADADTALHQALRLQPDLAVVDLSLPPTGGISLIGELRRQQPGLHVLVLTASDDGDDLHAALAAGAEGYVVKGSSSGELRHAAATVASGQPYVSPALAARQLALGARPKADPLDALTQREGQVLALMAQGMPNIEIADRLDLAEKTVKHHVTRVLGKLGVRSRTQAALLAQRLRR